MKVPTAKFTVSGLLVLACVLAACGGAAAPAGTTADANVTQSFAVNGDVTVTITTYAGEVKVNAGGAGQVQVQVMKHGGGATDAGSKGDLDNMQLSLNQSSGKINLTATHRGTVPVGSLVSFIVRMEAGSGCVALGDSGKVTIDGVQGGVTARTTSGDIIVTNADNND